MLTTQIVIIIKYDMPMLIDEKISNSIKNNNKILPIPLQPRAAARSCVSRRLILVLHCPHRQYEQT